MRATRDRLSLAVFAFAASVAVAQAQASDSKSTGSPASGSSPQAGMRMPEANAQAGQPGAMGEGMGRMMERMHATMPERGAMGMPFEHVEGRIAYLKAELKITDAQSALWNAFADTMRANAKATKALHDEMMKGGMPTTLPDRMAAQHKMLTARINMIERSEASTKALYASLSEDQRKAFDQIMSGPMGMM